MDEVVGGDLAHRRRQDLDQPERKVNLGDLAALEALANPALDQAGSTASSEVLHRGIIQTFGSSASDSPGWSAR
jgi:hypothetical protein